MDAIPSRELLTFLTLPGSGFNVVADWFIYTSVYILNDFSSSC